MVKTMRKVLWNRAMGLESRLECWTSAVATQGCASCRSAARPAPRNKADSRLIFQLMESRPKMPAFELVERRAIGASKVSMSCDETNAGVSSLNEIGRAHV